MTIFSDGGRPWFPLSRFFFLAALSVQTTPVAANNYGESAGWQFHSSVDRVNQAAVLDIITKHQTGFYQAPTYTTRIDRQFNCGVSATSTGNNGSQSTIANSPSVTGAVATAKGNGADTALNGHGGVADTRQHNSGAVGSYVDGSTSTTVHGKADQNPDSTQNNGGRQDASVSGSSGCVFGGDE